MTGHLGPRTATVLRRSWVAWSVHNLVAHPLLVLCPPLGRRLHDLTAPEEP